MYMQDLYAPSEEKQEIKEIDLRNPLLPFYFLNQCIQGVPE